MRVKKIVNTTEAGIWNQNRSTKQGLTSSPLLKTNKQNIIDL